MRRFHVVTCLLALVSADCSSNGDSDPDKGTTGDVDVSKDRGLTDSQKGDSQTADQGGGQIDPAGGYVTEENGQVIVAAPPNSVTKSIKVTIKPATSYPQDKNLVPDSAYELGPHGQTFSPPFQVIIQYDHTKMPTGVQEKDLRLHKVVAGNWTTVANSTVDTQHHLVSGLLDSFSVVGVLALSSCGLANKPCCMTDPDCFVGQCGTDQVCHVSGCGEEGQACCSGPPTCKQPPPDSGGGVNCEGGVCVGCLAANYVVVDYLCSKVCCSKKCRGNCPPSGALPKFLCECEPVP